MNGGSAIYRGTVRHRRFHPRPHSFSYSVFMAFLDVDAIPETMERTRFAGYNRFNWASFDERDHFGDPEIPLRRRLELDAEQQGVALPDGPIYLLTNLRYLGYCFNPISLFFCYRRDGQIGMVLAEVNNTFQETWNYWLGPHNALPGENSMRFRCAKRFHVSPFMGMDLEYDFAITAPEDKLVVHVNTLRDGESFFDATLSMRREPWSPGNLARALAAHPWMTAKVIGAIHWEAARLYLKGVPVHTHPARKERTAG